MRFVADLHIHSRFSRATSRSLTLSNLHSWAQRKGLTVVGTGDFTHPAWRAELAEQLIPAEPGLFELRPELRAEAERDIPGRCSSACEKVRFVLQVEISTIYKAGDRTRKVHHVILCPTMEGAEQLSSALAQIGNVTSDGRPILGLDSRDLLEMVLEHSHGGCLIPAHIWTPWFSVLGSKSGFDTIAECYRDLSDHIFAVETGLSSDPAMNWRVSSLDRYALISNSDAHSPHKLARECNLFDTELSYDGMIDALRSRDLERFLGTVEFFPEEGKYHLDGHRKCGQRLMPTETKEAGGRCPTCGRLITVGVMHRVEELADRPENPSSGTEPSLKKTPFVSLIGLAETVGHVLKCGPATKKVARITEQLAQELGPELEILQRSDIGIIERIAGDLVGEAIRRVRNGDVRWNAGYDGEYGSFEILSSKERHSLSGQMGFFEVDEEPDHEPDARPRPSTTPCEQKKQKATSSTTPAVERPPAVEQPSEAAPHQPTRTPLLEGLSDEQLDAVVASSETPLLVVAGPGTGKTRTLTTRIAHRIEVGELSPARVLALTFTNRAAEEMAERLSSMVDGKVTVMTFHAWGLSLLRATGRARPRILDDPERLELVCLALEGAGQESGKRKAKPIAEIISLWKSGREVSPEPRLETEPFLEVYRRYESLLDETGAHDFDDLVLRAAELLEEGSNLEEAVLAPSAIFVDEYQDLNASQVRMLHAAVAMGDCELFAIGDPDQAIYGFRGADPQRILEFRSDWPGARVLTLGRSFRSSDTILEAAGQVIAHTPGLERPRLWSGIEGQPHLIVLSAQNEETEAERIALLVERLLGGTGFLSFDSELLDGVADEGGLDLELSDIAVLYRLRMQGERIARGLGKLGLPVQMTSKTSPTEEEGSAEVVAALRVLTGRASESDLRRAETSDWRSKLASLDSELGSMNAAAAVESVASLLLDGDALTNALAALSSAAGRVDRAYLEKARRDGHHASFVKTARPVDDLLDWLALHSEADRGDPRARRITLTTLHAAKGLEWKVVVIAGCEDGLLPHRRPNRPTDVDEERRLFFVGMTRAEQLLVLSRAEERAMYGERHEVAPSPFMLEIEERYKRAESAAPKKRKAARNEQMELF